MQCTDAELTNEDGMGYILFLTKHHDGFCLWDTKTTERKVTKNPFGEDVLAKVRKSWDKHNSWLCIACDALAQDNQRVAACGYGNET